MTKEHTFQHQEQNTYLCIDFDSTIVDHAYPAVGQPVPGALEGIRKFIELGAKIILFTVRDGPELHNAISYLMKHGIKIYAVNDNPNQHSWSTSRKVYAHRYIDDLAAGVPLIQPEGFNRPCIDWSIITPEIETFLRLR